MKPHFWNREMRVLHITVQEDGIVPHYSLEILPLEKWDIFVQIKWTSRRHPELTRRNLEIKVYIIQTYIHICGCVYVYIQDMLYISICLYIYIYIYLSVSANIVYIQYPSFPLP